MFVFLARAFIQTFGITQPTPERERQVAWMLAAMLLMVAAVVAGAGFLLHTWFSNR